MFFVADEMYDPCDPVQSWMKTRSLRATTSREFERTSGKFIGRSRTASCDWDPALIEDRTQVEGQLEGQQPCPCLDPC